jgi:hypothetical protein
MNATYRVHHYIVSNTNFAVTRFDATQRAEAEALAARYSAAGILSAFSTRYV